MKRHLDRGFTLIELLISIVLGGVIAGVTVAALFTTMNIAASTTDQVNDSADAGLIAAFLYRDTQSAGAVDQTTGQLTANVGISTTTSSTEWSQCTQTGTLVVGFSWIDHMSATAQNRVYVTYALDSSKQLVRRSCTYGTNSPVVISDVVLGHHVGTAEATCKPTSNCTTRSSSVTLSMVGAGVRAPVTFTITPPRTIEISSSISVKPRSRCRFIRARSMTGRTSS
jgi:prepilin-type N-terminal cleavage/methylation domain-containing protein